MSTINIRIEKQLKTKASKTLARVGLDMSSAVKLFLHQVVIDKGVPFVVSTDKKALRQKWDNEVAEAKNGKGFKNAKDLIAFSLK